MNTTAGALARFWWIVLFGLVAGAAAAVAIYSLEAPAKHTATARLMVNSPAAPYLRTQQPLLKAQATRIGAVGKAQLQSITQQAPDTQTLVNAANLYPLLIESDRIARCAKRRPGRSRARSGRRAQRLHQHVRRLQALVAANDRGQGDLEGRQPTPRCCDRDDRGVPAGSVEQQTNAGSRRRSGSRCSS